MTSERTPDHAPGTVLALDNVPLAMPVARAGSRSLAAFFDYLLVFFLAVGWSVLAFAGMALLEGEGGPWLIAVWLLGLFVVDYGYFAGCELATGGRTLGKWIVNLQVVSSDGSQASASALLLRNLVRTPDLFLGVPLMATDPLARRLGDRLGGTLVIALPGAARELASLQRTPRGWGGREVAVLEGLLHRARELPPERARSLAQRIVDWIDRDDPAFLSGVERSRDPLETLRAGTGFGEPASPR